MKHIIQKTKLSWWVILALLGAATVGAMTVSAQPFGTVMHVDWVAIQKKDMIGRGPRPIVEAIVWIKDQSGNPVSDATVTGDFSGCFTKANASARTDINGQAFVLGGKFTCTEPCTLIFTVTGVAKRGATYDPSANVVTQGSIYCPVTALLTLAPAVSAATVTASVTLTAAPLPPGQAQLVLSLARGNSPEGIVVKEDGTICFSNRRLTDEGLLSEIIRIGDDGNRSTVTTFEATDDPNANGILGLAIDQGDLYAALDTRKAATHGVWKVSRNGRIVSRLIGTEGIFLPNGLTFDNSGNLYVSDSSGAIWRCQPEERHKPAAIWVSHELFAPFSDFDPLVVPLPDGTLLPVPLPGANGIAFVAPDALFVANTERGLLLRLHINADGSGSAPEVVAGNPSNPYTRLLTMDGIAVSNGRLHAVVPGFAILPLFGVPASPLVEINPDTGAIDFTVTDPAVAFGFFHTPLSLSFGTLPGDEATVYVTNGALFADLIPGPGPGIVRVGVNP